MGLSIANAPTGIEIIQLKKEGEWWIAQFAIHGTPSLPFDVHESTRQERFPKEEDFIRYLARQAETMIELYGDARQPANRNWEEAE